MSQLLTAQSDLEAANERLAALSLTDELTGISNRRALADSFDSLWAACADKSQPVALLMIDIDFFHQYNATYGHLAGDSVIRRIAALVRDCSQTGSELVVRYGGEEFLVVLPGARLGEAKRIADRIHDQVRGIAIAHSSSSVAPIVTVSVGVLALKEAAAGLAEIALDTCDRLLYEAKQAGRNRIVTGQRCFEERSLTPGTASLCRYGQCSNPRMPLPGRA